MSSRLGAYPERRLRPIYDWLDNGNNKKALQEAEKVLKKQPNFQCAKGLKCLALLRLGRETDSIEQLEALRKECPVEEGTLQLMTVCYREIHKPNLICDLYEWANQKEPGNEEILNNLFLSYVRVGDFKKQQTTAMLLYKVKPKNQYYFWIIISLLVQTKENLSDLMPYFVMSTYNMNEYPKNPGPIDSTSNVPLRLADRMIEKHVNEKKVDTDQEVLIYLIILEMQGKLKEALNVINGELGKKLELTTVINKRIDLLIKLEEWLKANELLKSILLDDIDAWNYFLLYLDTVFKLGEGRTFNSEDNLCPFYKAKVFLDEIIKENKSSNLRKRGPYLAQLEFYSRMFSNDQPPENIISDIVECMLDYTKEFGTKESCLHDLRPYVYLPEVPNFLSKVFKLVNLKTGEFPSTRAQMNLHLINEELVRVYGIKDLLGEDLKLRSIDNLMKYFVNGLRFNNDLPPTETRSNDRYAVIAAHALYEMWADKNEYEYLFQAIVLCHYGLYHSPSNSQLKILLLKFYHLLGGTEGAHNAYLSLDLKHMQLDTLGYLHIFPILTNGEYTHAKQVLNWTLKFFTNNFKESADHITFAYKYDALTKIPEFIHIREKLNYSTHYRQATVEKMLLEIFLAQYHSVTVQTINEMLPIDKIDWGHLQDNRDFTVLWDVDPEHRRLNLSAMQQTYRQDIVFLRFRSLLLQICGGCIKLCSTDSENFNGVDMNNDAESEDAAKYNLLKSALYKLVLELENSIEMIKNKAPNSISNRFIAGPPHSRLLIMIQCNYFDPILNELKFLLHILPGKYSDREEAGKDLRNIQLFFNELLYVISLEVLKNGRPDSRNLSIQLCALYVEMVSFSCLISGVCESVLRKFKQHLTRKNKKKKEATQKILECPNDFDWRADLNNKYVDIISKYIKNLHVDDVEKSWRDKKCMVAVDQLLIVSDLEDTNESNCLRKMWQLTNENLNSSYCSSLGQMATVLKQKLKYIGSHKI